MSRAEHLNRLSSLSCLRCLRALSRDSRFVDGWIRLFTTTSTMNSIAPLRRPTRRRPRLDLGLQVQAACLINTMKDHRRPAVLHPLRPRPRARNPTTFKATTRTTRFDTALGLNMRSLYYVRGSTLFRISFFTAQVLLCRLRSPTTALFHTSCLGRLSSARYVNCLTTREDF